MLLWSVLRIIVYLSKHLNLCKYYKCKQRYINNILHLVPFINSACNFIMLQIWTIRAIDSCHNNLVTLQYCSKSTMLSLKFQNHSTLCGSIQICNSQGYEQVCKLLTSDAKHWWNKLVADMYVTCTLWPNVKCGLDSQIKSLITQFSMENTYLWITTIIGLEDNQCLHTSFRRAIVHTYIANHLIWLNPIPKTIINHCKKLYHMCAWTHLDYRSMNHLNLKSVFRVPFANAQ